MIHLGCASKTWYRINYTQPSFHNQPSLMHLNGQQKAFTSTFCTYGRHGIIECTSQRSFRGKSLSVKTGKMRGSEILRWNNLNNANTSLCLFLCSYWFWAEEFFLQILLWVLRMMGQISGGLFIYSWAPEMVLWRNPHRYELRRNCPIFSDLKLYCHRTNLFKL